MKPNGYRYRTTKKRSIGLLGILKIILLLVLCALLVWILYREKIETFIKVNLTSQSKEDPVAAPRTGPPAITINLDGRNYRVEASETLPESSAALGSAPQVIAIGNNSKLQLLYDKSPDNVSAMLYQSDIMVLSTQSPIILAEELPGDGEYQCVCEVGWGLEDYKETAFYHFTLLADFPSDVAISSSEINPGELLVIRIENLNPEESLEIETDLDYKPSAFKYGNKRMILIPVSYYNESGKVYQVKLIMEGETHSYAIKVNDKDFTTQYMTIDTKVAAETRNDKSSQEVTDKINPLKPISDLEPYWSGKFIMPVEGGRVTETDFGKKRYVNNAPTSYRHNGLDIGHDKGTPVMASNNGRVLLTEYLIGTGNTIILEHGFGLKTWYYHMNELSVKTGDWVMQGDIIGKVGSTGFSTGPHLHFSTSVNGVFINPITLINEGVPLHTRD